MSGPRLARFSVVVLIAAAVSTSGQERPSRERRAGQHALRSVKRLACAFSAVAAGEWRGGGADVRVTSGREVLRFTIADIDSTEGTARITRGDGAAFVSVQRSGSNLYFLDLHGGGPAALTTVFSQESTPGRLKAVHVQAAPEPAQYSGDCEVLE